MTTTNRGIPTHFAGVDFRSRIEARWANFFTKINWRWVYEPLDLGGWIPDFAIVGPNPLLVEVKADLTLDALREHVLKIIEAKPPHDVIIVGAMARFGQLSIDLTAGVFVERSFRVIDENGLDDVASYVETDAIWAACQACFGWAVFPETNGPCRPCGHNVNHGNPMITNPARIDEVWNRAANDVQWMPRQRPATTVPLHRTHHQGDPVTTTPTSTELRRILAYLERDADQLGLLLPELHRRHRMPRGDRDGLRSIAPTGTSRPTDVPDPTHHAAMANIAADEHSPNITPATPTHITVDHIIRSVMLAGNLLAEAVRGLVCIDPGLAPAALPACQVCCCVIVDREGRTDDQGKPVCDACHRRSARHAARVGGAA